MATYIREKPNFAKFTTDKSSLKSISKKVESNLFVLKNVGKTIVRFDIIKTNFNIINRYDINIFESDFWVNFVMKFTDLEIMKKSKILREVSLDNWVSQKRCHYLLMIF